MKDADPRWGEVVAVLVTAAAHQVLSNGLGLHAPFIVLACVGWGGYVLLRLRQDPTRLASWGFARAHSRGAWIATTAIALPAIAAMAGMGLARDQLTFRGALWATLALYPLWGLVQQTLVQVFVARSLRHAPSPLGADASVVLISALLFAAVHAPQVELMGATLLLGGAFTAIYLRWPNLWPLGLWHGWLGAFFYAWVLGKFPLVEMLARP